MNIPQLATRHNGHATWTFSQGDLGTWRHYRTFGICAGLSAEWIRLHAWGGSLANVLGSGGVGRLNVRNLKTIATLHANASSGDGDLQSDQLELWLRMHGVVSLRKSVSTRFYSHRAKREMWQAKEYAYNETGFRGDVAQAMIDSMRKFNGAYARVNFGGTAWFMDAGHAVAVWLGTRTWGSNGDAILFDPNHGEYWFEDKDDFFRFFPDFYQATYMTRMIKFNQNWEVLPCARKVVG